MGTVGGTFFLIGVGLLYQATGTLNMADLAARCRRPSARARHGGVRHSSRSGICIKLAVFPLHQWLPNAYTYAPARVSAFLAATATKVVVLRAAASVLRHLRRRPSCSRRWVQLDTC